MHDAVKLADLRALAKIERGVLADAADVARSTAQRAEDPNETVGNETRRRLFDTLAEAGVTAEEEEGVYRIDHKKLSAWKAERI